MTETPGELQFNRQRINRAPEAVVEFAHEIISQCGQSLPSQIERRGMVRFPIAVPVLVMPLDENYQPVGPAFEAVTRDLSAGGMALLHTRAVNAKFLALEIEIPQKGRRTMILEVLRCRPSRRFYEIAGKFVARVDG